MKNLLYLISGLFLLAGCQPHQAIVSPGEQVPNPAANARTTVVSAAFAARQQRGTVKDGNLNEISGLALSRTNPGYIWVQEDSGNPNKIYLIDETGTTKATVNLPDSNRDWEDIAVGPGPTANTSYIYLADVGNNNLSYSTIYVYRFVEPSIAGRSLPYTTTLSNSAVKKLDFVYDGGTSGRRNCETLMIDPLTKDLYFITKEDNAENKTATGKAGVYRAAYPQKESGTNTLVRLNSLDILTATGGDISANGQEVLIKNYKTVYYWKKSSTSQSIA
ncbi:MAG TPA: hypothetical protein VK404_01915, partial [Spirosoma sp.]|nr:hypothetical protein [Spirosoma sp.]